MDKKYIKYLAIAGVTVLVLFGLYWRLIICWVPLNDRGQFGDMFGALNSLFTGLAFAGLIVTIIMQSKELKFQGDQLKIQGDELKIQSEALISSTKEFVEQNKTLKRQRFETTFFNMISLHHQIVNAMEEYIPGTQGGPTFMTDALYDDHVVKGRVIFKRRYDYLKSALQRDALKDDALKDLENTYLHIYKNYTTDFGHYFRNLYRIIKLIDETDFQSEDKEVNSEELYKIKYKYTSIVRAQLSDYELTWLFYNCVTKNGKESFKPLIEHYSLLKNLSWPQLASFDDLKLYKPKAYKLKEYPTEPEKD